MIWKRDPDVLEIIRHFDQPERKGRWDYFKRSELELVKLELDRCQSDFVYAAKNYFQITDKDDNDIPFFLWESQELILERLFWLRSHGRPMKLMVLKARQLGALDPSTRVLTTDLVWTPIEELRVGQEVIATDEQNFGKGNGRKMRRANILDKWWVTKPAFRIVMENGQTIIATGDHRFLCKTREKALATKWIEVSRMRIGEEIRSVTEPWTNGDYEDGWYGGLLDGEGYLRAKACGGVEVGPSQIFNKVFDRAAEYLRRKGYTFHVEVDRRKSGSSSKFGNQPVAKLLVNRMDHVFRLMGQTRPSRFIQKPWWEGKGLPGKRNGYGWNRVVAIESVGTRPMVDIRTTTGTFIAEGFVTHNCSVLIEALIAWRTMFYPNTNALVVSNDDEHAEYLYNIMLHIYNFMPWWLKPQYSSLTIKDGLEFDNPNMDDRRDHPGLNSRVMLQSAQKKGGVGQGTHLSAVHLSEYADFPTEERAREIIDGDLPHAFHEKNPNAFAVLESTAKGAGTYAEDLWNANIRMGERAEWHPLFLPWFFEKTRVLAPPQGWHINKKEEDMRNRIMSDWVICDYVPCRQYRERPWQKRDLAKTICPSCKKGTLKPVILTDSQLCWMEDLRRNKEERGDESVKQLKQELASTSQEAFQLSGYQVFPPSTQEFVNICIDPNPLAWGNFDEKGYVHHVVMVGERVTCLQDWCRADHRWDEEHPLQVWEWPRPGARYTVGADIAEGLGGKADFSVAWVNRLGEANNPDVQVAMYRTNTQGPIEFARQLNMIGRMYNEALMAIEVNKYDSCYMECRNKWQYPNMFRWKHYDSTNILSNKWGWVTQYNTKPRLWQTAIHWLKGKQWIIRSSEFLVEMKRFQKEDPEERGASHERGSHDDVVMAAMICLFCSHDMDYSEDMPYIPCASQQGASIANKDWELLCSRCHHTWDTQNPDDWRVSGCPKCGCINFSGKRKSDEQLDRKLDWNELSKDGSEDSHYSDPGESSYPRSNLDGYREVPAGKTVFDESGNRSYDSY